MKTIRLIAIMLFLVFVGMTLVSCSLEDDVNVAPPVSDYTPQPKEFKMIEGLPGKYKAGVGIPQGTVDITNEEIVIAVDGYNYTIIIDDQTNSIINDPDCIWRIIITLSDGTVIVIGDWGDNIRLTVNDKIIGHYYIVEPETITIK